VFLTPDDDAEVVAPDTEYRYGGAQWQVAGGLAEAVAGKPWAELIDEIYVQPCGIDSLGYNNHFILTGGTDYPVGVDPSSLDPTENPNMEGGAFIDPPDYAELLLMHLRGGECPDGQVLSPQSIDRLHADRTLEAYPEGADAPGYGLGWWIDRDSGLVSNNGAYGVQTWLDLDDGYGVYLVVEANGQLGFDLAMLVGPLIDDGIVVYRSS
jgi:CubicO group peptidase (beta-lactamase class C family)